MGKMKCIVVLLVIFCIVSSMQMYAKKSVNISKLNRKKRQEEPWIWGIVDHTTQNNLIRLTQTQTTESSVDDHPCDAPKLQLPDFNAPGRRIAEVKCYEYIWEIKNRQYKFINRQKCQAIREKNGVFPLVIGGRSAFPGEFPHMAAIGWKAAQGTWIFSCGGSLISPKFVLTAAHCTKAPKDTTRADPIPKMVRLGDKNIKDIFNNGFQPIDQNIVRIIVHPQYKPPKKYFDIALLELARNLDFYENLQPACLWTKSDTSSLGTKATLTGWGVIQAGSLKTSPVLNAADVDIIDSQKCEELLRPLCNRNWCGLQEQICAGVLEGGVDACQGDSGGPLQVKIPLPITEEGAMHYVIGVTQFGYGCAAADRPGVYTRVSSFLDWIESIVWK